MSGIREFGEVEEAGGQGAGCRGERKIGRWGGGEVGRWGGGEMGRIYFKFSFSLPLFLFSPCPLPPAPCPLPPAPCPLPLSPLLLIRERYHEVILPQGRQIVRGVGLEEPSKRGYPRSAKCFWYRKFQTQGLLLPVILGKRSHKPAG